MQPNLLELAAQLSKTYHAGQRYGTEDYFEYHITGVVDSLKIHHMPEKYLIVGYLHDIVEDTEVSLDTVQNLFGEEIKAAVAAITKRENESRDDYLARCSKNPIARFVKLHDALFNASNCFKNKNKENFAKYLHTISKLT